MIQPRRPHRAITSDELLDEQGSSAGNSTTLSATVAVDDVTIERNASSQLQVKQVGTAEIAGNAVTASRLAANAVSYPKLWVSNPSASGYLHSPDGVGLEWASLPVPQCNGFDYIQNVALLPLLTIPAAGGGVVIPFTVSRHGHPGYSSATSEFAPNDDDLWDISVAWSGSTPGTWAALGMSLELWRFNGAIWQFFETLDYRDFAAAATLVMLCGSHSSVHIDGLTGKKIRVRLTQTGIPTQSLVSWSGYFSGHYAGSAECGGG